MLFRICAVLCNFYPRPPRGGRPVCFAAGRVSVSISIHALREEGDSSPIFKKVAILNFYPRPPRGGRRGVCAGIVAPELISIHALREEGDPLTSKETRYGQNFYPRPPRGGRRRGDPSPHRQGAISIHALREEGDRCRCTLQPGLFRFLSTPSARRATSRWSASWSRAQNFYPRPPRGGRPMPPVWPVTPNSISIHALREEGDTTARPMIKPCSVFLSTPSARRATCRPACILLSCSYFYPRPPRGGRRGLSGSAYQGRGFLSTPSARRATSNSNV